MGEKDLRNFIESVLLERSNEFKERAKIFDNPYADAVAHFLYCFANDLKNVVECSYADGVLSFVYQGRRFFVSKVFREVPIFRRFVYRLTDENGNKIDFIRENSNFLEVFSKKINFGYVILCDDLVELIDELTSPKNIFVKFKRSKE